MSPRMTREESKARTRARLVEAAAALFYAKGYAATSMEQIAEAAEVTKGAIYVHFASKEDLFLAIASEQGRAPNYTVLGDRSLSISDALAAMARQATEWIFQGDRLGEAMVLEYLAACLRRPDMLERHAQLLQSFGEGDALSQMGVSVRPDAELSDAELGVVTQALVEGLVLYRFIYPEVVTANTFVAALKLLAPVLERSGPSGG